MSEPEKLTELQRLEAFINTEPGAEFRTTLQSVVLEHHQALEHLAEAMDLLNSSTEFCYGPQCTNPRCLQFRALVEESGYVRK